MTDILKLMDSPLLHTGRAGNFVQLILAEAATHGMPANVIALLADLSAMLGFSDIMPEPAVRHLAGPLSIWRTHPDQPAYDQVDEVLSLAIKQRALIAFGGGPPDQMVGTAEIVMAIGNIIQGTCPPEYWEIYTWASVDVLRILSGDTAEQILAEKENWKPIADDEVLKPSGRLYETYQTIATTIRREAIRNVKGGFSRHFLRPLAARFIESHRYHRDEALAGHDLEMAARTTEHIDRIDAMFPRLGTVIQEVERYNAARRVERLGT